MPENTNQDAAIIDDGSDLFVDATPTSTAEEGKATEGTEPAAGDDKAAEETGAKTPEQTEAEAPKSQTLRIKYNGEEKDITFEEATTLAQKGMNYDKLHAQLEAAKNNPELITLDNLAKQYGTTRQQMMQEFTAQYERNVVAGELEAVQKQYPNMPDEAAMELAKTRAVEKLKQSEAYIAEAEKAAKAEELKPWERFKELYPDIKDADGLPRSVIDDIANNETSPVEAMQRYDLAEKDKQIAELKKKLEAEIKNNENKQASTGGATSTAGTQAPDPFTQGFMMG
jgi:hypothetical protein